MYEFQGKKEVEISKFDFCLILFRRCYFGLFVIISLIFLK